MSFTKVKLHHLMHNVGVNNYGANSSVSHSSCSWPRAFSILPFNNEQRVREDTSIVYSDVKPGILLIGVANVLVP